MLLCYIATWKYSLFTLIGKICNDISFDYSERSGPLLDATMFSRLARVGSGWRRKMAFTNLYIFSSSQMISTIQSLNFHQRHFHYWLSTKIHTILFICSLICLYFGLPPYKISMLRYAFLRLIVALYALWIRLHPQSKSSWYVIRAFFTKKIINVRFMGAYFD